SNPSAPKMMQIVPMTPGHEEPSWTRWTGMGSVGGVTGAGVSCVSIIHSVCVGSRGRRGSRGGVSIDRGRVVFLVREAQVNASFDTVLADPHLALAHQLQHGHEKPDYLAARPPDEELDEL